MPQEEAPRSLWRWAVWVGLVVGLAMRVWILLTPSLGSLDPDESVVGLMARHFADGELTVFFWGQSYGGTIEPLIGAGLFRMVPPNATALKLAALGFHALGSWLTWRIGRRVFSDKVAAIAAVLAWAWPTYAVWRSVRLHGFYGAGLVLCLAVVLLVLRIRDDEKPLDIVLLGLTVGLGWWTTGLTALVVLPAVLWLIYQKPGVWRRWPLVVLPAIAGAAPWLWSGLIGNSATLQPFGIAESPSQYLEWLGGIFVQPLPAALGLRVPGSPKWLLGPVVGTALYGLLLAGLAWSYPKRAEAESLLWIIAVTYPLLLALSEVSDYRAEPRYLYFLMPILALLLARLAVHLPRRIWLSLPLGLVFLSIGGLWIMSQFPKSPIVPADFSPVVSALEEHGVDYGFAYHTIAYRLMFESGEKTIVSAIDHVRYLPYDHDVRASEAPAYIFAPVPEVASEFAQALNRAGISYSTLRPGDFIVFVPDAKVLPEDIPALQK